MRKNLQKHSIIPPLSAAEQKLLDEEIAKRSKPLPGVPEPVDFPLHDIVRELGLDQPADGTDPEFYEELKEKDAKTVYKDMKEVRDIIFLGLKKFFFIEIKKKFTTFFFV